MTTLRDALSNLEEQTHQIHDAALQTASKPLAGRFTKAYLQGTRNIFSIIREAAGHERGLFDYIGESSVDSNGQAAVEGMGTANLVERRKPGLVTPLKKPPSAVAGGDDPVKLLQRALTLVDEYRSMPRARAHVVDLMESFLSTQQAIKDLEEQIEEAKQAGAHVDQRAPASSQQSQEDGNTEQMHYDDPEEWLRAEEESVKRLEREIAKKRRNQPPPAARSRMPSRSEAESTPSPTMLTRISRPSGLMMGMQSPGSPLKSMRFPASPRRRMPVDTSPGVKKTPVKSGLGREPTTPIGTESMEESTTPTPTRPGQSSKHASPGIKPIGASTDATTPRFAQPTTSSLSAKIDALTPHHRNIISPIKKRVGSYTGPQGPTGDGTPGPSLLGGTARKRVGLFALAKRNVTADKDATRGFQLTEEKDLLSRKDNGISSLPAVNSDDVGDSTVTQIRPAEPIADAGDETVMRSEAVKEAEPEGNIDAGNNVQGIEVDSIDVQKGIATVWAIVPEVLKSEEAAPEVLNGQKLDPRGTIELLAKIGAVNTIRPPSPSNASIASSSLQSTIPGSAPAYKAPPATEVNVLLCHLILAILREGPVVSTLKLKEQLQQVCVGKGWHVKVGRDAFYAAIAKKLLKVDRSTKSTSVASGGTVRFEMPPADWDK